MLRLSLRRKDSESLAGIRGQEPIYIFTQAPTGNSQARHSRGACFRSEFGLESSLVQLSVVVSRSVSMCGVCTTDEKSVSLGVGGTELRTPLPTPGFHAAPSVFAQHVNNHHRTYSFNKFWKDSPFGGGFQGGYLYSISFHTASLIIENHVVWGKTSEPQNNVFM